MKLRNIFTALAAAAIAFVGCQQEERFLDEVQVDKSMVTLDVKGGSADITVTATADWKFAEITDVWPNVIKRNDKGEVESTTPSWLSVNVMSGAAGETKVTFSAEETAETRELTLELLCAGAAQQITVVQMAEKVETPISTCAEVLAEKTVGKVYKCKGTITDLTNYSKYGCFYINDGTGTVYVYGSMNPDQFSPEVGDIITFEGPWTSYGNFDDATILSLEKSLIKLEKVLPEEPISLEGGKVTAVLTIKEGDLEIVIPEDAAWLTAGEPYVVGTSTFVDLTATANEAGARETTVTFKVNVGGKDYFTMADIQQEGAIAEVSVADFLSAEVGEALYKVSGILTKVAKAEYGNVYIKDATGEMFVYGIGAKGDFETLGLKVGDIVTLIGKRGAYNDSPQMAGAQYDSHKPVTTMNAADVAALADDDKSAPANYIMLTGKVTKPESAKFDLETYGNFDLVDESGSIYVYGVSTGWNGETKKFASLGVKENDIITIVAYKTSYNGAAQVVGMYVSHEAAPAVEDDTTEGAASYTMIDNITSLTAGTYYMAGYLTTYENNGTTYDWSAYPYHVCTGVSTDLYTATYAFADGNLTKNPDESYDAVDVILEAIDGKENAYYVKIDGGYLYSTEYSNRKLAKGDTAVEWVATNNANGGITLTTTLAEGTVSIGTAGASSKLIRSYKNESTLKYGLVFFKQN